MQLMPAEILAWWTKMLRASSDLSQEALAASAGLPTRTIQRIEAGRASNIQTRRALARGLGYDNQSIFDDLEAVHWFSKIWSEFESLRKDALEAQFPDRVKLPATRVSSGAQLGRLAESINASCFRYDEALGADSKAAAAAIFDYLREYGEVDELYSETAKLAVYEELDELLRTLEATGVAAHSALRRAKLRDTENSDSKPPVRFTIGYLVIDKADREIQEIWPEKQMQFTF
jgi:DNA-binding XRE family transcriptional regulator